MNAKRPDAAPPKEGEFPCGCRWWIKSFSCGNPDHLGNPGGGLQVTVPPPTDAVPPNYLSDIDSARKAGHVYKDGVLQDAAPPKEVLDVRPHPLFRSGTGGTTADAPPDGSITVDVARQTALEMRRRVFEVCDKYCAILEELARKGG